MGKKREKKLSIEAERRDESNIDTQHFCRFCEIYAAMRITRRKLLLPLVPDGGKQCEKCPPSLRAGTCALTQHTRTSQRTNERTQEKRKRYNKKDEECHLLVCAIA